jgi:hypothetical protein
MAEATIGEALGILSKVSVNVDNRLKILESAIGKTIGASGGKIFEPKSEKKKELVQTATPVIVTDFGRKAEQDLAKANAGGELEKQSNDPGKGGMGFIKKLIGPALLVLGGLSALVTGLMSDGPLKGLLNILSKGGIIGGVKLFQKMASKQLATFTGLFAKLIPTDLFAGVIKKAKGFLGSITKFLLKPFAKIAGKGGAKSLFGTIGKLFGKILKPLLKRIPGIGSLISWGFAISRFKSGDIVGGLIDVASGIATLFPGIGTGISIGLDVLNAFLDAKKGGKDEKVEPKGSGFKLSGFFGKIKDKIMNNYPIKNLMQMWGGIKKVFSGDFKEGLTEMAYAIPFMKPLANFLFSAREEVNEETGEVSSTTMFTKIKEAVMNNYPIKNLMQMWGGIKKVFSGDFKEGFTQMAYAIPFMKPLGDFIFGKIDEETGEKSEGALASLRGFFAPIKDKLLRKVLNILPETILGVSVRSRVGKLLGINMGSVEDDMEATRAARDANTSAIYGDYAGMSAAEQVAAMEADGSLQKIDDGIVTKNGQVVIPSAQDTVYAMKDGGPLADALNKTPTLLGNLINIESSNMELMYKNNLLLTQILEKINSGNPIITSNNTSIVNTQKSSSFRDMQFAV